MSRNIPAEAGFIDSPEPLDKNVCFFMYTAHSSAGVAHPAVCMLASDTPVRAEKAGYNVFPSQVTAFVCLPPFLLPSSSQSPCLLCCLFCRFWIRYGTKDLLCCRYSHASLVSGTGSPLCAVANTCHQTSLIFNRMIFCFRTLVTYQTPIKG